MDSEPRWAFPAMIAAFACSLVAMLVLLGGLASGWPHAVPVAWMLICVANGTMTVTNACSGRGRKFWIGATCF